MKILHVVPSLALGHGGVSASVRELCRELARLGEEIHLWTTVRGYCSEVDSPLDQELKSAGVRPVYFGVHPWSWLGDGFAYSPELRSALAQSITRFDLVHIHAVWLHTTQVTAALCRRLKIPYVLSPCGALDPYGLEQHRLFKFFYGWSVERRNLAGAAAIHFTSPREERLAARFGSDPLSFVIQRCIRIDSIPQLSSGNFRKRYPDIGQRRILLFLGRLEEKKRLDIVARSFSLAASKIKDLHLVIAGPDEGAGPQAQRILGEAGLLNQVTFTGQLSGKEKWEAFQDSSLFLLPSEDENFGLSVLEAMAAGVPVLVSPSVGIAEAVTQEKAGWVTQGDPQMWASSIEKLLADPERLRTMGEAGRRAAAEIFSPRKIAQQMQEAYAAVLKKDPW